MTIQLFDRWHNIGKLINIFLFAKSEGKWEQSSYVHAELAYLYSGLAFCLKLLQSVCYETNCKINENEIIGDRCHKEYVDFHYFFQTILEEQLWGEMYFV